MKHNQSSLGLYLSASLAVLMLTAGCNPTPAPAAQTSAAKVVIGAESHDEDLLDEDEPVAESPAAQATPRPQPAASAQSSQPTAKATKAPARSGKTETIYVETDGAQGRVWGHVTMKGDRGTGTIHDWDENTLAVSVTRHGNELFAVDQNSRQYVFKVK